MRYQRVLRAPGAAAPLRPLAAWSSLEEYELDEYFQALLEAFADVEIALTRVPTGELAACLRSGDFGAARPDLVFGTAATVLSEPAVLAQLAPLSGLAAPAAGPEQRWLAASGFRNAIAVCAPALRERGLVAPVSWTMLADPRYRGLIAFPDPASSGAGSLALASICQALTPEIAWGVIAGLRQNVAKAFGSSWACAEAALDPETPIAVSVEIACLRLADQAPQIRTFVPRDASAVELEGFAMLAGARDAALCREVLAWAVSERSRAVARRWRKVTLDDARGAAPRIGGSFLLDHARAAQERAALAARYAALPSGARAAPRVRTVDETYRHGLGRDGASLIEALEEGLSGTGRLVAAYEAITAAEFGAAHAIAVSSGSAAVLAALAGLRLPRGGKVVVSPLAPLCTVYPIMALGLEPVFCDTNPADFGLCVPDLERVLSPDVAAVVEVPMWGYPVPANEVAAVCRRRAIPYVLDLAHGHRIRLHGRDLSRFGQLATFSTHEGKILSTGEGGMVLTDDAALAQAVRSYTRFGDLDGRSFGINLKLSGVQAALGARRMKDFARDLAERQRKAKLFFAHLHSERVTPWPICSGGEPNYYAILVEVRGASPHAVIEAMGAAGVPSDKLKYPCQVLYRFELLEPHARPCPNAEALIARLSTVPVHPDLEDGELIEMARIINQVTASRRDTHATKKP